MKIMNICSRCGKPSVGTHTCEPESVFKTLPEMYDELVVENARLRARLDCLQQMAIKMAGGYWLIAVPDGLDVGLVKAVDAIIRGSDQNG